MRTLGMTERQRRFVAEYRGAGDGLRAVQVAGYTGSKATLKVRASTLLKHPAVAAAVEAKFAKARVEREKAARKSARHRPGIGSTTRRLEILMSIAEDETQPARDRIRAVAEAAEIAGEKGRHRLELPPPGPTPPPDPAPNAPDPTPSSGQVRTQPRLLIAVRSGT